MSSLNNVIVKLSNNGFLNTGSSHSRKELSKGEMVGKLAQSIQDQMHRLLRPWEVEKNGMSKIQTDSMCGGWNFLISWILPACFKSFLYSLVNFSLIGIFFALK